MFEVWGFENFFSFFFKKSLFIENKCVPLQFIILFFNFFL